MANGILNLVGALILVGAVLAVALIVLWVLIRPLSSKAKADWRHSPVDEQDALDLQNSDIPDLDRSN